MPSPTPAEPIPQEPASRKRRLYGTTAPFWLLCFLVVYELLALVVGVMLVSRAWPGNPFYRPIYAQEERQAAMLQVTLESIRKVDEAIVLLSRLPEDPNERSFSHGDAEKLLLRVTFAYAVIERDYDFRKNSPDCTPCREKTAKAKPEPLPSPPPADYLPSSSPTLWSSAQVRSVLEKILIRAHRILELRATCLRECQPSYRTWARIAGFVIQPAAFCFALTNSEETRFAQLMSEPEEINKPVASPTGDDPQVKVPLPDVIAGLRQLNFLILLGALGIVGASAQSLASLAGYVGNQKFSANWTVFYLTRPLLGAVVAAGFCLVLRGGLVADQSNWKEVNHVGYAAVAVLVGFCVTEALENLRRIGSAFFARKEAKDGLESPDPHLGSGTVEIDPDSPEQPVLVLRGANFAPAVVVLVDGVKLQPPPGATSAVERQDSSNLLAFLPHGFAKEKFAVQVQNPGEVTRTSNTIEVSARLSLGERVRNFLRKREP